MKDFRIYRDLEQGTQEWLEARRGILTASVIGRLITPKTLKLAGGEVAKSTMLTLIAERITGEIELIFPSRDMERGTFEEPIIRSIYAMHYAPVEEIGFMTRTYRDAEGMRYTVGYSPDGLVGEAGLIEIKSRRPKKHLDTILSHQVPIENMAQLQTGLMVSGREWIDYVSFCGGMPLYVHRVYPDPVWHVAIRAAAEAFERRAQAMIADYDAAITDLIPTEKTPFDEEIEVY